MALSAFDDPGVAPTREIVAAVLDAAAGTWTELVAEVRELAEDVAETWVFGGPKTGWSMRLVDRGRVLVYLTPQPGRALVGVVLGEKAIAAADAAGHISASTRAVIDAAPRYAEGRGVRITMATPDDLLIAVELASAKIGAR